MNWKLRAAVTETRFVLEQADTLYQPFSCPASGECCQLTRTGRPPWLWEPEWRLLEEALLAAGRELPKPRADGGCPFLDETGRRCSVYSHRPFGCRTFFCSRVRGPGREPLEQTNAHAQRLERVARKMDEDAEPLPLPEWHRRALAQRPA